MTRSVYRIEHETRYAHTSGVSTSQHVAYLTPRTLPHQAVHSHDLVIDPPAANCVQRTDYFGNSVTQFTVLTPYDELSVLGRSVVQVSAAEPGLTPEASLPWEQVREALLYRRAAPYQGAAEFSYASPYAIATPALAAFARESFGADRPLLDAAVHLMHRIHDEFTFDSKATTVATAITDVLAHRRGVCQDFAHLQIGCLRSLGLPARYVSGYLLTEPPPGKPRPVGADASHAWLSVWCPHLGWVDLDPTNDVLPSLHHITVAWGRDYGDVCPLRGIVLGGREHRLHVAVSVTPLERTDSAPPRD
jgi:transglutaminase-like putative cysteine protease